MSRARQATVDLCGTEVELRYDFNAMATLEEMAERGEVLLSRRAPERPEEEADQAEPDGDSEGRDEETKRPWVRSSNVRAAVYAMALAADQAAGRPQRFTLLQIGSMMPMGSELMEVLLATDGLMRAAQARDDPHEQIEAESEGNAEAPASA